LADDPTSAGRRPNLTKVSPSHEVEQVLAARTPIYRQCADLEVDTEQKAPAEVAEEIIARLHLQVVGNESP
jgi:shikimate kinase